MEGNWNTLQKKAKAITSKSVQHTVHQFIMITLNISWHVFEGT